MAFVPSVDKLNSLNPGEIPVKDRIGNWTSTTAQTVISSTAETDENIIAGNILYVKQNGHLALASSVDNAKSQIVGLALENGSPGFAITYSSFGNLFLNDWTNILGSVNLVPGTDYFLDTTAGKITSNRPFAGYLVGVGKANSAHSLMINLQIKIQL